MAINLSRNTRLWVSTVDTGNNNSNTFEIPIQEGYSLSQAVSSSDISVSEAGPTPIRGSKRFNDALEPVEWSFSTYITPYLIGGKVMLVDAILWQGLAVKRTATPAMDFEAGAYVVGDNNSFNISFANNSGHVMTELFLFFKIDNTFYKVKGAQVSSAEISVDIEDIAMVSWSGQAKEIETISAPAWASTPVPAGYDSAGVTPGYVSIPTLKEFILNKLTTMTLVAPDIAPGANGSNTTISNYSIPITGASVSINNNITFVTPSTLAEVDKPIGSFTGSFEVTGSVDAYLRTSTGASGTTLAPYTSADLLSHMTSAAGLAKVANATAVTLSIGGTEPGKPAFVITMPTLHLAVPNFNIEDVVSTSIEFKAIPNSADLISGSELTIEARVANP